MLQRETITETNNEYRERITSFSQDFEIGLFIHLARKSLWWVLLFFALAIAGAFLYLRYTPPLYEAWSTLQLKSKNKASALLDLQRIDERDAALADIEIIGSKEFLKTVFNKLPLSVSYFEEGEILTNERYKNAPYRVAFEAFDPKAYHYKYYVAFPNESQVELKISTSEGDPIADYSFSTRDTLHLEYIDLSITILSYPAILDHTKNAGSNKWYFTIDPEDQILNKTKSRLELKVMNQAGNTVRIVFQDKSNLKAADVANAVAEGFLTYDLERQIASSNQILEFIDEQIESVFERLRESEVSIQEFKIENKVSTSEDFTDVYLERLTGLEEEQLQLELEENVLNRIEIAATGRKDTVNVYDLLPLLAGTPFQLNITDQITALHALLLEKERALYEVSPGSERIKSLSYQVEIQKKLLLESVRAYKSKISIRKNSIEQKVAEIENTFTGLPLKELRYSRLKRVFTINEKFYTLLLEKKAEYAISKAGIVSESTILERAAPTISPISPRRNLAYLIALVSAFVLSIALIIVRYLFYNEVSSLNEIVKLTQASVNTLGIIPRFKENIPVSQLVIDKRPKSMLAEAFRAIRSNMEFIGSIDGSSKIAAITSTISGEGKTFIAINLGGIIALSGKKVVILDLDMRKPKIHKGFDVENKFGMSTLLIGKDKL
ncbi:MAG: hypothetical protein KDC37_05300, partial [Flavobacteriales bacterium]|nr:hypothetical protein [Flavobacteriales bacterium]